MAAAEGTSMVAVTVGVLIELDGIFTLKMFSVENMFSHYSQLVLARITLNKHIAVSDVQLARIGSLKLATLFVKF